MASPRFSPPTTCRQSASVSASRTNSFSPPTRCATSVTSIAAVAAVDETTAEQALDLIECDYAELPAALTLAEALSENAPLVHEQLSSYRLNTVLARDWHPVFGTNIAHQTSFSKGDIDKGFAEADEIFDDTFRSQQVQHCSLEPHAVVAEWNGDRLTRLDQHAKSFSRALRFGGPVRSTGR